VRQGCLPLEPRRGASTRVQPCWKRSGNSFQTVSMFLFKSLDSYEFLAMPFSYSLSPGPRSLDLVLILAQG
jgi:hypothetical protein